jgi:hypothetical protein
VRSWHSTRTSNDFTESDNLLLLAQVASRWKCRPSELLRSQTVDWQIDLAGAVALTRWEESEMEKAQANRDHNG